MNQRQTSAPPRAFPAPSASALYVLLLAACAGPQPLPVRQSVGDANGSVSADGAWVLFEHWDSSGAIALYVARVDGSERRLLFTGAGAGDWAPDGATVAASGGGQVVAVTLATGEVTPIAEGSGPAYSPDGTTIAFSSFGPFNGPPDLWTAPAGGGTATRIPLPGPPHDELRDPDWAPDGVRLVATKAARLPVLFITRTDGTDTSVISVAGWELAHPAWSPTGNRIAYVRASGATVEVWLISPDGSAHKRIASDGSHPHWYPDGARLVITRRIGSTLSLWSVDTVGQNLNPLWSVP